MWKIMLQGYTEAPSYFSQVFAKELEDLNFLCDSVLMQFVGDLIKENSENKEAYKKDSNYLLS